MPDLLFRCRGGTIVLPDSSAVLIDRADGGNLVINPPRTVWERSELTLNELIAFSCLVAATGAAMLDTLPQLQDGCLNYWEAGNWALNDDAHPKGRKIAREHRSMHLHLLGRNPRSTNPRTVWGEAPEFPRYAERERWASSYERLHAHECASVIHRTEFLLRSRYSFDAGDIHPWKLCARCGYPCSLEEQTPHTDCS